MPYALGIDLGSGRTTAAISRNDHGRGPEVVALDGDPAGAASVLHVTEHGTVEVGEAAVRALPERAAWVARGVAERVGDEVPVALGGEPYPAEVLTAAVVGWVVDYVEAAEGTPATHLVVTHPASWGMHRRAVLMAGLREVTLPELTLLPRPVAAAESLAAAERVEVGEEIAVHALGSTRFEAAVLRRGSFGFELRAHLGFEPVGGALFDDLLAEHVLAALERPPTGSALASLRASCTVAKERLSAEPAVSVSGVRVERAQFEDLIRGAVESTAESLRRTVESTESETLRAVVLVGGCANVPLVKDLVSVATRARVVTAPDPATAIARGAALAAAKVAKPTIRATAPAMIPEPLNRAAVTHTDLMRLDDLPEADLSDLGPPPPRPPVDIAPLEPPKRRLLSRRPATRTPRDRDREFADLDVSPVRRKRPKAPADPPPDAIEGDYALPEREEDDPILIDEPSEIATSDPPPPVRPRRREPHPTGSGRPREPIPGRPRHSDPESSARSHPNPHDTPIHPTDLEPPHPNHRPPLPDPERPTRSHPDHPDLHPSRRSPLPEPGPSTRSHPDQHRERIRPANPESSRPNRHSQHHGTEPEPPARSRPTRHRELDPTTPEPPARSRRNRHREPDTPEPRAHSLPRQTAAESPRHFTPPTDMDPELPRHHRDPEPRRHRRLDAGSEVDPGPSPARSRRHRYRDDDENDTPSDRKGGRR